MPVRLSFRAASLTTAVTLSGAVAGCAVATGDGTQEETKSASEAMAVPPGRSTQPPPPQQIWADTYGGSAAACTNTEVPIPAQLEGLGCTLGAQSGSVFTAREWAYAWGCPESVVDDNIIPASGGFGLAPPNSAGTIYGESITITFVPSLGAACFGNADFPTKVLVVDTITGVGIKGGCRGGCDN